MFRRDRRVELDNRSVDITEVSAFRVDSIGKRPLVVTPEEYERGAVLRDVLVGALRRMERMSPTDPSDAASAWEEMLADLALERGEEPLDLLVGLGGRRGM